jgi:iron complex transport system substrate-binding protein
MAGVSAAVASPVVVRDDRAVEHRFDAPPQRAVSLLPSLTEAVCAIGACARLVGTDRYSNWPSSVVALPKLGGLDDAVVERIVGLRPDVVLAASSTRALARLESLGLKVLRFDSDSHEQVRSTLDRLGRLFGAAPAAHAAWKAVEADMVQAAELVPLALRGRKVYFEADATPYAAGEASFVGQTLQRLHLRNIAPAALGAFPRLSPEFVVQAQPQVILAARRNATQMMARPGWQQLPALQGGQVCAFDEAAYELLIRPGPRMGEAAKLMAACLAALPPAGPTPR